MEAAEQKTELAVISNEQFIENGLKKFEITEESLIALRDKYKDLKINGIEDRAGLKAVHDGRMDLVKARTNITKNGKGIRQMANDFSKAILAREKKLIDITLPTEEILDKIEKDYNAEKERLRLAEEKAEADRIANMIAQLDAVHYAIDYHDLIAMNDEQFQDVLKTATESYDQIIKEKEIADAAKAEEERLAAIARQEEADRLEKQREYQEAKQKELDDQIAAFKAQQEKSAADIKAKEDALEAEKKAIQEAKDKAAKEAEGLAKIEAGRIEMVKKARFDTLLSYGFTYPFDDLGTMSTFAYEQMESAHRLSYQEAVRKKADEDAKAAAEVKTKQDEVDRIKRERVEKEAQQEALQFGEDSDRFAFLNQQLQVNFMDSGVWSHMKSKKGKNVAYQVRSLISQANDLCKDNMRIRTAVPVSGDKVDD